MADDPEQRNAEDYEDPPDEDEYDDDYDPGEECGRWINSRLTRNCRLAGTEFCDFECPYRDGDDGARHF